MFANLLSKKLAIHKVFIISFEWHRKVTKAMKSFFNHIVKKSKEEVFKNQHCKDWIVCFQK